MPKGQKRTVKFIFEKPGGRSAFSIACNKSEVNAHVARQAHIRRREQEERSQDATAQNPSRQCVSRDSSASDHNSDENCGLPSPVVLAGNSDPFSSKAIAVTADVNWLLTFTRDFILPATHVNEVTIFGGRLQMERFWTDSVRGLDDGGTAGYAYLARAAAILSSLTLHDRTSIMTCEYLGEATTKLRKAIIKSDWQVAIVAWEVYALFSAEVAAGNFTAAAVHGQMLRRFLQPPGQTIQVEQRLLMAVLQQDITRATLSLTKPSFDLQRWRLEHLPPKVTDNIPNLQDDQPSAFPFSDHLSPSLTLPLRLLFLGVREWLEALGMIMLNRAVANLSLLINGAMKILVVEGQLIDHYLDSVDQWDVNKSPSSLAEACLSLAALYWVRRAAHERLDVGSKLEEAGFFAFDMSLLVLTRLRDLDIHAERHAKTRSTGSRLWWLHVGTMAECNVRSRTECGDYHGTRFLQVARELGLSKWSDIEHELQRFLYVEMMGLKTARWFVNKSAE